MAFDSKPNLSNDKFEQFSGETLTLKGTTEVHGRFEVESGGIFQLNDGTQQDGYVMTSNASGEGTWQLIPITGVEKVITQASHGFILADVIAYSGTSYIKAIADGTQNGETLGIVSSVVDANTFNLLTVGFIDTLTGLSANTTYFVSDATAGLLTSIQPTTVGSISKPILVTTISTEGYVLNYRGLEVGSGSTSGVAGSTTEIQYNDNGSFGAFSGFTFNDSTKILDVEGEIAISGTSFLRAGSNDLGSIELGSGADTATGNDAIAIGTSSTGNNTWSIALGNNSIASGLAALGIGGNVLSSNNCSIALGNNSIASGIVSLTIGNESDATNTHSIAIGGNIISSGVCSTSIGSSSCAIGLASTAVGAFACATASNSVAISNASAIGTSSVAIGQTASATGTSSTAIGLIAHAYNTASIAIGLQSEAIGLCSVAIGRSSYANNLNSVAIGVASCANNSTAVALGTATALGNGAIAVGNAAYALTSDSLALGHLSKSIAGCANAIGRSAYTKGILSNAIGVSSYAQGNCANAIGTFSCAYANSIAIGTCTNATGATSIAMGLNSKSCGSSSIAIGNSSNSTTASSVSIGSLTYTSGIESIAIGSYTKATGSYAIAMGENSCATGSIGLAIGRRACAIGACSNSLGISHAIGNNTLALHRSSVYGINGIGIGSVINSGATSIAIGYGITNTTNANRSISIGVGQSGSIRFINDISDTFAIAFGEKRPRIQFGTSSTQFINGSGGLIIGSGATTITGATALAKVHIEGDLAIVDGTQQDGYVLTSDGSGIATWQSGATGGGGSGERIEKAITQASHGFAIGEVLAWSGGTYIKALADGTQDAETLGIVSESGSTSTFTIVYAGYVDGLGSLALNANTTYYLSTTVEGGLTSTEPTTTDEITKPILTTLGSAEAVVFQYRGYLVASATTGSSGDGVVSGATLNGTTLELGRTEGLGDVTVDLAALHSDDGVVSGATLTGTTVLTLARTEGLSNVIVDLAPVSGGNSTGSTIVGDDTTTGFTLTHNFATRDVIVQVFENQAPYGNPLVDVERTTTNAIDVNFAVAPATGTDYRVLILEI